MTIHGSSNPLLALAVVLAAGVLFGNLARFARLPSVTGQILVGILVGPSVLGVLDIHAVESLRPVTHFALGLIAVMVGSHLHVYRLRNAFKRLSWLVVFEATLTPLAILAALWWVPGTTWEMRVLLAAMAVATAPATTIALVRECKARGVFVKTLVAAVALNNITCILLFELAHASVTAHQTEAFSAFVLVREPLLQLGGALTVGGLMGLGLALVTQRLLRRDRIATASVIAIMFTFGFAEYIGVSSLLGCMFLGIALTNFGSEKERAGHGVFEDFQGAITAIFFTLAGMELDFQYVVPAGLIALLVVAARAFGKTVAAFSAMKLAGATDRVCRYLGPALVPQAGVAVGLILIVQENTVFDAKFRQMILAIGLTVVTLNELIGPILARNSLRRSGDAGQDRARLIDFLTEENIITELSAETKEDAIRQLTDVLIQSNDLQADRDQLLESILAREADVSTCVGGGLAVPHGVLEEGDGIVGAMGISREGLPFKTPDGKPVHCMVVLGTPPTERDRHLEVLAVLARAIGTDPKVQVALFNAMSPAHAYEVLHAEESEGFNYFLDGDGDETS